MNQIQEMQKAVDTAIKNKDVKFLCKFNFNEEISPLQQMLIRKIAFCLELNIFRLCVSAMTRWGKSYCVSRGIALFLMMNKDKKVYFLGPKNEQALILRDYMTELVFKCPALLKLTDLDKGQGMDKAKKESSRKRVTLSSMNSEYRVFSAEGDGNRLMGHGLGIGGGIIVLDESTLISNEVRAKITRMLGDAPEKAVILELFNPWNRESKSFDHTTDPTWEYIHIGWQEAIKDGRITQDFIDMQRRELTDIEFTVLYESHFPLESNDQLIPYWAIQKSIREPPKDFSPEFKKLGVDPAERGLDLTVRTLTGKKDSLHVVLSIVSKAKDEPSETAEDILKDYEREIFHEVKIDSLGVGSGVFSICKKYKREDLIKCKVSEFRASQSPTNTKSKKEFKNLKAEAGFFIRELFVSGNIIIPPNIAKNYPKLIKELGAMKWEITTTGHKRVVDPGKLKDDPSEEKSPDFYDSLVNSVFKGKSVLTV